MQEQIKELKDSPDSDHILAHCASDATVFKTTSCMLHPRPNATSEILETDKGVAEKIKLVPLPGTRMFREWVCNQIRNSGVPEYYVGKISKLFLDESRPRASAEGLLEDALDQRNYLARLFLDSRLKAKLEKEIKRAEKEMLKSVKAKADENVVNNQAQEDDIFRRARARKELADYCDKMRTELHESEKKMKKPDPKTSEDQMFYGLKQKMKAEEAQQKMKAEEAQQKMKAEEAQQKMKAEGAQQKTKAEEGEINREDVRRVLENFKLILQGLMDKDAQENVERDTKRGLFIEEVNSYVRELHEFSDKIEGELKALIASGELLDSICERDNNLEKYEKLLIDA